MKGKMGKCQKRDRRVYGSADPYPDPLLMTYFVLHVRIEDDSQNLKNGSRLKDEPLLVVVKGK